jgi:hypothetical protein
MKYEVPIHLVGVWETTDSLKELQSEECKKEMNRIEKEFISCLRFTSSAERALAKEIFECSWRLSRYYKELL